MIEVSIISGTYKRLPLLQKMVESARMSAAGLSYEIILVGVAEDAETLDWIRAQPDIRPLVHDGLLGAIKAYDDGAALARGEYVVFANDDLTFVGGSIGRAVAYMRNHREVGVGLFYTNRSLQHWHVAEMPAHRVDGSMANAPYGGIMIAPRWLGDRLKWWALPGARTYGGDNAFCARAIEAGWPVVGIKDALVDEPNLTDGLKLKNSDDPAKGGSHPDSEAYLKLFPQGPELGHARQFDAPPALPHILYAPIYERGHAIQHAQKCGLRRALQRVGIVREVDYLAYGPDSILKVAADFQPSLVLTQFHSSEPFGLAHVLNLRKTVPNAVLVNWNGDPYDKLDDVAYLQMLRMFDLHLGVNARAMDIYTTRGIRTAYWQIGYEADGVGSARKPTVDVVFLGNGSDPARQRFGKFLKTLPYKVALYGSGWGTWAKVDTTYDFRAGRDIINRAKVVLGHSPYAPDRGFVSNRLFQSLAAGGALVLHQEFDGMTDLLGLVDGVHLVTWANHNDLARKLAYYLDPAHETERATVARAGQLECLRNHSFEKRVAQLFALIADLPTRQIPPAERLPEYASYHEPRQAVTNA